MIEYLVKKRKITVLFFIMFVIVGFVSFFQMPHQEMPEIPVTFASVTTIYPGASPEKIEKTVTEKIEAKIKEIQGLKTITSYSSLNASVIWVEAENGVNLKEAWNELRKKVKDAENDLPTDAEAPNVNDDVNKTFLQSFNVTADSLDRLIALRELFKEWKDQLRTVPGVADVQVSGLPEEEVKIQLDSKKLQNYHITWKQVFGAIQGYISRVPLGEMDVDNRTYQLTLNENKNIEELKRVVVAKSPEGFPVYLKDIADVALSHEKIQYYVYHNGKPAIAFNIISKTGSDVASISKRVNATMAVLEKSLPDWATKEMVYTQEERVSELFSDLTRETLIAIAAVILVCSLGLNFITASVVALAIPISLAVGLLFAPFFGITLNQISIISLIIVLGILVDDAVVVNDNIERRLSVLGEKPLAAAVNGANEVLISILTATMATIASFAPLIFLKGNTGNFIKPVPIIISFAMLASMLMSLTIIPIFRQWYEKRRTTAVDYQKPAGLLGKQIHQLTRWYADKVMPVILRKPLKVALIGITLCTAAYGLIPFTPVEIFPKADRAEMLINISVARGNNINETEDVAKEVSVWLQKQPGVNSVASYVGGSAPKMFSGDTDAGNGQQISQLVVRLDKEKLSTAAATEAWSQQFKELFPGAVIIPKELESGPPVGKPVVIRLFGSDIDTLRSLSVKIQDEINHVEGTYNVQDDVGIERYALDIKPNKNMLDEKLVTYEDFTSTIRLVSEGLPVGDFDDGKNLIQTKLYVQSGGDDPINTFRRLTVPNLMGEQVPVMQLAQVKPGFSIAAIPHRDLSRTITITSEVRGRTATDVMKEITPLAAKIAAQFPEGYHYEIAGEISEQNDIFSDMGKLSIIVLFLIVIMIAMQFNSLSLPLLVMSTIYLAISGSIIGLFVTRTPIGFMTIMGAISLLGIVVRNGIVLIEFIENARKEGIELREAVIHAGEARLRPILLTSATAVAGLMPLAVSGDVLFQPLAITIISGLMFSTALTLIIVPCLYTALALHNIKKQHKHTSTKHISQDM